MIVWRVDRTLLEPEFAADIDALLAADPAHWVVTYGFRTRLEQAALYKKFLEGGPRAAPPGTSAHESGLAVDLTLVVQKTDIWDYHDANWLRLVAAVLAHPRLHSLANIGDTDHIEKVKWRQHMGWQT